MSQEIQRPLPPPGTGPRVVLYHQTHHGPNDGPPVSLLPLIANNTGITHIIIAAIHINEGPGNITLNDHPPDHPRNTTLWGEVAWVQASGVKVLGMLGGAAKGSFDRLDGDDTSRFEAHYAPLRDILRRHRLDGIDLDIEEPTTIPGTTRLIDRLRADFGPAFLITLAPVATGLLLNAPHLSGPAFDYHLLEQLRGHEIAWYNVGQRICTPSWRLIDGRRNSTMVGETRVLHSGTMPSLQLGGGPNVSVCLVSCCLVPKRRLTPWQVLGLLTNPSNGGSGFVPIAQVESVIHSIRARHPDFGGIMGWEYFNALPGDQARPWEWAARIGRATRGPLPLSMVQQAPQQAPIRPFGTPMPPAAPHPYPAESIRTLQDLGFSQQQAVAALNSTSGNVEYAAGLLFQD